MKPEEIYDNNIRCQFKVYRQSTNSKVISCAIWKHSMGYVFNLANSLLWWKRHLSEFYPGWNLRIYIDLNLFDHKLKKVKDTTDWEDVINNLLVNESIELWFVNCGWGRARKSRTFSRCSHRETFMSMVRFHPFDDPSVQVVFVHNLELLTSEKEVLATDKWLHSGKMFHFFCMWSEQAIYFFTEYVNFKNVKRLDTRLMATFGLNKGTNPPINFFPQVFEAMEEEKEVDFRYGIDEIVLTAIFKPLMTLENTFITYFLGEIDSLMKIEFMEKNFRKLLAEYQDKSTGSFRATSRSSHLILYQINSSRENLLNFYQFVLEKEQKLEIQQFQKKFIDQIFFQNFKSNIVVNTGQVFHEAIEAQLLAIGHDQEIIMADMFREPVNAKYKKDKEFLTNNLIYCLLKNSLIYCLDMPGYCIKKKEFLGYSSKFFGQEEDDPSEPMSVLENYGEDFGKNVGKIYL